MKLSIEIDVDKAKELMNGIAKHIHKNSTSVILDLKCFQDKWDKSYKVQEIIVGFGGEKC